MMMFLGICEGIVGLTAIFYDKYYLVTSERLIAFDFTTWGWIHLILAIVVFFAGLELFRTGAMWARVVAVSWQDCA